MRRLSFEFWGCYFRSLPKTHTSFPFPNNVSQPQVSQRPFTIHKDCNSQLTLHVSVTIPARRISYWNNLTGLGQPPPQQAHEISRRLLPSTEARPGQRNAIHIPPAKPQAENMDPSRNISSGVTPPEHSDTTMLPVESGEVHSQPDDDIPVFSHPISAIFVPLNEDLLTPVEPPKDRVEFLQRKKASLDANEKAVRDNLAWMFEREARRLVNEAKKTRPLTEPHEPRIITWDEGEKLLASVATPANPEQAYHLPPEVLAQYGNAVPPTASDQLSPHEKTVHEVLWVASHGSQMMEKYSKFHIRPIRERLSSSLEREKKKRDADSHTSMT